MFNYDAIPEHMRDGLRLYINEGIPPGSFMTALLCNDLRLACQCADSINRYRIFDFVSCFVNEIPMASWGSEEKFSDWISHRGIKGLPE